MTVGQIIAEPMRVYELVPKARARTTRRGAARRSASSPTWPSAIRTSSPAASASASASPARSRSSPTFIVCDEPVSALDVSIQGADHQSAGGPAAASSGLTYLFIAHDLAVVRHISTRRRDVSRPDDGDGRSRRALRQSAAPLHAGAARRCAGAGPGGRTHAAARAHRASCRARSTPPNGCVFHTRCPLATEECRSAIPAAARVRIRALGGLHQAENARNARSRITMKPKLRRGNATGKAA